MSVVAPSESAADRALALRMRADLEIRPQRYGSARYWVVKDPLALKYFHLRDEEHAVLLLLDGSVSLNQLRSHLDRHCAPRRISLAQVQGFLAALHRYGLVMADAPGQGVQLLERHSESGRRQRMESLLGVLAIRFRGFNPARLLDHLVPWFGWVFSLPVVVLGLLVALSAAGLVLVEFDTVLARLPDFQAIVGAANLPWLALSLAGIKVLHELGHAVVCRRMGGDCHELGFMLLVFTPCLYCNVSDAWMQQSKWKRIAVSAAGMYVEVVLAGVATWLWWFSQPGLFNSLCLNTMIVCSFGTLLINGNPLLRYDGYFILADLVEVPNLRAESSAALRRWLARTFLGLDLRRDRVESTHRQTLLVVYGLASLVYRWLVAALVLWALLQWARPYHAQPLVALVAGITAVGMIWPMVLGTSRLAQAPREQRRMAPARVLLTVGLAAALIGGVLWLPAPMRVTAPAMIDYRGADPVYVTVPGQLEWIARVGDSVEQGAPVARLTSSEVEMEIARLTGQRDVARRYLKSLEAQQLQGALDGAQLPGARAALEDIEQQLAQVERDAQRLTLLATQAGTVLPGAEVPRDEASTTRQVGATLPRWSGTPLDARNLGTWLTTGTLVCLIGNPDRFEATLHVDERDIELVDLGQRTGVMLDHLPGQVFEGTVSEIARLDLQAMPRELAAAGDVPSRTDERGVVRPVDTWYQVRVRFDQDPPDQIARAHGQAKINVARQSLGAQLLRALKQTFAR